MDVPGLLPSYWSRNHGFASLGDSGFDAEEDRLLSGLESDTERRLEILAQTEKSWKFLTETDNPDDFSSPVLLVSCSLGAFDFLRSLFHFSPISLVGVLNWNFLTQALIEDKENLQNFKKTEKQQTLVIGFPGMFLYRVGPLLWLDGSSISWPSLIPSMIPTAIARLVEKTFSAKQTFLFDSLTLNSFSAFTQFSSSDAVPPLLAHLRSSEASKALQAEGASMKAGFDNSFNEKTLKPPQFLNPFSSSLLMIFDSMRRSAVCLAAYENPHYLIESIEGFLQGATPISFYLNDFPQQFDFWTRAASISPSDFNTTCRAFSRSHKFHRDRAELLVSQEKRLFDSRHPRIISEAEHYGLLNAQENSIRPLDPTLFL